jgi:hypothetical protein
MRFRMHLIAGAGALAAALIMVPSVAAEIPSVAAGASTAQVQEASHVTAATHSIIAGPGSGNDRRGGWGINGGPIG